VEITIARKRLEEMRADLDRSISILQGEKAKNKKAKKDK